MFDDTTQRLCPDCGGSINWAATRCKYCWHIVKPLNQAEAAAAAPPDSDQREALRLVRDRDSAGIEALLVERDRLREELAGAKTALADVTGQRSQAS
jgi:predicted amidophosphoribosyltransferase